MDVEVLEGDALAVTGREALVVPANRQLTLGWGSHVAEAVLRAAGPGVEAEALATRPGGIRLGEAVVTSAGRLGNFRRLVHAAVLDKHDYNPLFLLKLRNRTSEATLAAATTASLEAARADGIGSLVFTPMGAGIGGMRDDRCAAVMVAAFRSFPDPPAIAVACRAPKAAAAFRSALSAR